MSRIDPEKEYDLFAIRDLGVLHVKDVRTVGKIVMRDYWGDNLLKVDITGEGRRKRYSVRGKNLIKFLERYGSGLAMSVPPRVS